MARRSGQIFSAPDNDLRIQTAWERALALHSDSAGVLFNGALFLERSDPQRALSLLMQAKSMSSGRDDDKRYLHAIGIIHAAAIMPGSLFGMKMPPTVANTLRSEIEISTDPGCSAKLELC